MACRVTEILMIIKTKIPSIFQEVIDNCKKEVENFEIRLASLQTETEEILDSMTLESIMPDETLRRFKDDQTKALLKFREDTEKNLRVISEKALSKIRDLNKKSQEIVNSVVDFQREIKEKISEVIDQHEATTEPNVKLSDNFRDLTLPLHINFIKIRKEVDRITKNLPRKMDVIYKELQADIKKLGLQTDGKINTILEKYKRLTEN